MSRMVHVDFRKWPVALHWQFDMFHLGDDEWGKWLWSPPGTTARRGGEAPKLFAHTNVKLIVDGAWWTAIWNNKARYDLYVDIITPPRWNGHTVTMIDLDLDVERDVDGTITILDEDEFSDHQVALEYPQHIIDGARTATDEIAERLQRRDEPFYDRGRHWMGIAQTLS